MESMTYLYLCTKASFVRALISAFKARRELALDNVALRQQLAVLCRTVKRRGSRRSTAGGVTVKPRGPVANTDTKLLIL